MKMSEALIAYNPGTDQIKVGPLIVEGGEDWTAGLRYTAGAAFLCVRSMTGNTARLRVMSDFIGIVVRDGVDLKAAHSEFMKIAEYRASIPSDMSQQN